MKVFFHAQYNEYEKSFSYTCYNCDMSEFGYTFIESQEIEIRQPSFEDLTNKTVKSLRDKQSRLIAEAQKEAMRVQQTIDTLLYLEHRA